jgi:hypothetical protein
LERPFKFPESIFPLVSLIAKLCALKRGYWLAWSALQRLKRGAWDGVLRRQGKFKCVGGNCLAREEISTFVPKEVHIVTFIGHLRTVFGIIGDLFDFVSLRSGEVRSLK